MNVDLIKHYSDFKPGRYKVVIVLPNHVAFAPGSFVLYQDAVEYIDNNIKDFEGVKLSIIDISDKAFFF